MRMMGADSVAYHRETVIERADDHRGAALAYYASRGETPLVWGGSGADPLGLAGAVSSSDYETIFGVGGARHPASDQRLTATRRPGVELVVGAHKSLAVLGLINPEHMHAILDAERDATLAYLDDYVRRAGGRRGRAGTVTPTSGLVWAHTRHATSRAGDPAPHDHVLIANLVEMLDERGGWKALDTAGLRDALHAATAVGRQAGAWRAVELGYAIVADDGRSGRLGQWAIAGVPDLALHIFSKRTADIDDAVAERGVAGPRARAIAARTTREHKRHTSVPDLIPGWLHELEINGAPLDNIATAVEQAATDRAVDPPALRHSEAADMAQWLVSAHGPLTERKVFTRHDAIVAAVPHLFGRFPTEVGRVVDLALRHADAIPLIGVAGARVQPYTTASVLAVEVAIARVAADGMATRSAVEVPAEAVRAAIWAKEARLGHPLTDGQAAAIDGICRSGRQLDLVLGVAGSGKTTALDIARAAFEAHGHRVFGTATSGQAARTLAGEAGIDSRTVASLLHRLDHGQLALARRDVLILDEAGMTDDRDVLRLLLAARTAGTKVVMVGDDRQLGPVGPGGSLQALLARAGSAVHVLDQNIRQHDRGERLALTRLRAGDVQRAVAWYATHDRIQAAPTRDRALEATVDAWHADVRSGLNSAMYAWRRVNVADLNVRARARMAAEGCLHGPELVAEGGRRYQAGDRITVLAPTIDQQVVNGQTGTVTAVDAERQRLTVRLDTGLTRTFTGGELDADHLDHAYATTIHRAQGATVDTAHRFHDGGGRELAYVANSRARQGTTIHAVADTLDQALDDLEHDWTRERRPRWALDLGSCGALIDRTAADIERHIENTAMPRDLAVYRSEDGHRTAGTLREPWPDHGTETELDLGVDSL
jgi:conjugative relaxase-like TrwC/TraI family protein